jgi:hypothetical protein
MTKFDALIKGILFICSRYPVYKTLTIQQKVNVKAEIAYWYEEKFCKGFYRSIRIYHKLPYNKETEDMLWQEYLFAVGL